jgi:hypothetical protein
MEPTACETRSKAIESSFQSDYEDLTERNPDCQEELELLKNGLCTIGQLIHTSPSVNGNGRVWKELITRAEAERTVLSKHLDGKALFTAVLRFYAATHRGLRETLLPEEKETPRSFANRGDVSGTHQTSNLKSRSRHLDRGTLGYDPRLRLRFRQGTSIRP